MRARRFAERFLADADLLDVIELHDDAYLAWRHGRRTGDWVEAERRARALLDRLGDRFGLFMRFYQADNETGDKTDEHRHWLAGLRDGLRLETARLTLVAAPAELAAGAARRRHRPRRGAARRRDPARLAGLRAGRHPARRRSSGSTADPATLGYGVWVAVAPRSAHRGGVGGLHRAAGRRHDRARLRHPRRSPRRRLRHRGGDGARRVGPRPRTGVRRVIAECDESNPASIRVLEKVGMRRLHTRAGVIRWTLPEKRACPVDRGQAPAD